MAFYVIAKSPDCEGSNCPGLAEDTGLGQIEITSYLPELPQVPENEVKTRMPSDVFRHLARQALA